jgi:nucleotide-binding universal stress UspA family protein
MSILLAYIHTPEGDAALSAAVDEARQRGTGAVVVTVTRPVAQVDPSMSTEQRLDAVTALFEEAGVDVEIRQLPSTKDRAGAILGVVAETAPELVVIGMRRRNPVGELIVGSTSQRIIRSVDCPVLLVKAAAG